jgi:molybdate transport system permease protein
MARGATGRRREPTTIAAGLVALLLALFLGLPVAALIVRAANGESLGDVLRERVLLDALALSLVTTLVSLGLAVIFGTPLAFVLARRRFRGIGLLETIVDLPIVLPPSVAGLALLLLLGRRGALGGPLDGLGVSLPFTTLAVVLAQAFVATPLYVRSVRSGLLAVDRDLEDAARVDGAGEWDVVRRISLPVAAPAVAAGLVLTWARALGEFGATIMFAGNVEGRTQTLPLLVYSEFQSSLDASVAAAAILILAAAGVLLGVRLIRWRSVADLRAVTT